MKIHDVEPLSLPWCRLHFGIPTASGLSNLVTPIFELRTGEMVNTYLHRKLAEAWRNQPLIDLGASSFSMEQGLLLEESIIPWYEFSTGKKLDRVGFIMTDDGKFGCSPDAVLLDEKIGLEIKAPAAHTHVKYLIDGVVPKEYVVQVHGSLYCTGWDKWIFISYRRGFPALIVEVERDRTFCDKIKEAVDRFHANYAIGWEKLKSYK
jgi:predicted phage-related endonuclease